MTKSGAKLIGVALLMLAIGAPLAKVTDGMTGIVSYVAIGASIILCIAGLGTFLYGFFKLGAGLIKRS